MFQSKTAGIAGLVSEMSRLIGMPRKMLDCGHVIPIRCGEDPMADDLQCSAICGTLLPCGHGRRKVYKACHLRMDSLVVEIEHGKYISRCGRLYSQFSTHFVHGPHLWYHVITRKHHGNSQKTPCLLSNQSVCVNPSPPNSLPPSPPLSSILSHSLIASISQLYVAHSNLAKSN